jgi:hypothetical protein
MKREAREPWRLLTGRYVLCWICRYAVMRCDDLECIHPIEVDLDLEPLDDCWRFRPEQGLTLERAAARVRMWLRADVDGRDE